MPRVIDHDKQRADLLARSFTLFAERGYGEVTMRALSRELGLSTGSLYHYFEGKPALFRQLLLARVEQDVADAEAEVPTDLDAAGRMSALLGYVQARIDYLRQLVLMSLDYYQLHPEDRPFLAQVSRRYRAALVDRLGLPSAELGPLLYSFVLGMVVHRTLDPESVDLPTHVAFLQQFAHALND